MKTTTAERDGTHTASIYFDSECELCKYAVNRSSEDFNRIPLANSEFEASDSIVVKLDGKVIRGFDGAVIISEHSKNLFPLLPILFLFRFLHIGNLIYSIVAENRKASVIQIFFKWLGRYAKPNQ